MKLWLNIWSSRWNHLLWRLGMIVPMLFSQYSDAEEDYEEQKSNGWIVLLVSLVVLGVSVWSFFL